jgi:hypothetical protein
MPHLYGHFDESGKFGQHPIVSLSGLVGDFVRWQAFTAEWLRLLRECGLPVLHATEILSPATPFGTLGSADRTVREISRAEVERRSDSCSSGCARL